MLRTALECEPWERKTQQGREQKPFSQLKYSATLDLRRISEVGGPKGQDWENIPRMSHRH